MKKKLLLIMTIGYFHTTKNKQTDFEKSVLEMLSFKNSSISIKFNSSVRPMDISIINNDIVIFTNRSSHLSSLIFSKIISQSLI